MVDFDIAGNFALSRLRRHQVERHLAGFFFHFDHVAVFQRVGRNGHALAVDRHVAVVDELARREHRGDQFHAVDDGVETALEQLDQIVAAVALAAQSFEVIALELALTDVGVIAFEFLFRVELNRIVGRLLTVLAVLAGAVFAFVEGGFRPAPEVDAKTAVDFVFSLWTFSHCFYSLFCCPGSPKRAGNRLMRLPHVPRNDRHYSLYPYFVNIFGAGLCCLTYAPLRNNMLKKGLFMRDLKASLNPLFSAAEYESLMFIALEAAKKATPREEASFALQGFVALQCAKIPQSFIPPPDIQSDFKKVAKVFRSYAVKSAKNAKIDYFRQKGLKGNGNRAPRRTLQAGKRLQAAYEEARSNGENKNLFLSDFATSWAKTQKEKISAKALKKVVSAITSGALNGVQLTSLDEDLDPSNSPFKEKNRISHLIDGARFLQTLPERTQEILYRYIQGETLETIGNTHGLTKSGVCLIIKRAQKAIYTP